MTFTSPRRGIAAAIAALVSAVFIMPSGTAFAAEQSTPHSAETEAHTTLPSENPTEEASVQVEAAETSEPTEAPTTPLEGSQSPAPQVVEQSKSRGVTAATKEVGDDAVEKSSRSVQTNTNYPLICEPGYVYSIGDSGQLYAVNLNLSNNNARSQLVDFGSNSGYNGLGIGAAGGPVYAYQRSSEWGRASARIVQWDGTGGPSEVANYRHDLNGSLVAGAVDLDTGHYYFGGYEPYRVGSIWGYNAHRLRIWRYVPEQGVNYVGYVDTGIRTSTISRANGDFAFNDDGDLFFLVSGDSRAAIGTITARALSNATGGAINASVTNTMELSGQGTIEANGIAFDSDGSILLGSGTHIYNFDPSNWKPIGQSRQVLTGSTDLAGCNSPSSIEILKNIEGRKSAGDQFTLSLHSGSQEVTAVTTEGETTGVQEQQVGPTAVRYGDTYRIRETMAAGSSSLDVDYDTTYECTVNNTVVASGEGTEFNITVQHAGKTVTCEFTNTPVPDTQLTLRKEFDTSYRAPENTDDWVLTATPKGGQTIEFFHGQTKNVEAGQHTIAELFGDDKVAPDVAGYELAGIACTTNGRNNPVTNGQVTLQDRTSTECVLTNKGQPGSVVWQKTDTEQNSLAGSEWKLTGPTGFGDNDELIVADNDDHDADKRDGYFKVKGLPWGKYELEELTAPDGYQLLEDAYDFTITGTDRDHTFEAAFENIAIPTLTLYKGFDTKYGAPDNPADWNLFATTDDQQLTFEHGVAQRVEAGKYTLLESFGPDGQDAAEAGYELQEVVCSVDGGSEKAIDSELTIRADTTTECTLINTDLPGAVEWQKTNMNGTPLADSEWRLSGPDGFGELTVVDNGKYDVDKTAGTIRVEALPWGDYTMKETKAPAGFELTSGEAQFTISGAARNYTFAEAFINEPLQPGTLPLTGIFSGKWPLIGAAGMALAVLTGLVGTLRRRNSN